MIEARDVFFTYEGEDEATALPAVNGVSISVRKGEYVCLLGRNGSGKSTLAKLFSLILAPDSGEILINGKSARSYSSQGQQRSLALCLKLAEGEIVKKDSGEYPVFLLDDVLSELDEGRRKYLIDEIKDKQVIMTSCENDLELSKNAHVITVKDGTYCGEAPAGL